MLPPVPIPKPLGRTQQNQHWNRTSTTSEGWLLANNIRGRRGRREGGREGEGGEGGEVGESGGGRRGRRERGREGGGSEREEAKHTDLPSSSVTLESL